MYLVILISFISNFIIYLYPFLLIISTSSLVCLLFRLLLCLYVEGLFGGCSPEILLLLGLWRFGGISGEVEGGNHHSYHSMINFLFLNLGLGLMLLSSCL